MKERINELRLDAGIGRIHEMPYLVTVNKEGEIIDPLVGLEKFAEMIIRECAIVASDYDGAQYVGIAIEKHFGIEE